MFSDGIILKNNVKNYQINFKISNIVASTNLSSSVDIEKLARIVRGSIYEPEVFSGLYFRLPNNQATITIFSSGKLVCTGAKSEKTTKHSILETIFDLGKILSKEFSHDEIKFQNVVATADFNTSIDLEFFSKKLKNSKYNIDEFPCIFMHLERNITLLIFHSGKIVSVGAKSEKNAKSSILFIKDQFNILQDG
jgi:transcription initiation factor TFIID TATA-box-binding protein